MNVLRQITTVILCKSGLLLGVLLVVSCNSDKRRAHALIHQAEDIFKESSEIEEQALQSLRLITAEDLATTDSMQLVKLNQRLVNWQSDISSIAVSHNHDDEHDHDHDHSHGHGGLELLPEDMVLIQHEFQDSIKSILADVNLLKERLGKSSD